MDASAPFLTYYGYNPDHTVADGLQESINLFERQSLIEEWIAGRESVETVLDCLEEQGVGADHFVEEVKQACNLVVNGKLYVTSDAGLLLPARLV